MIDNIIITKKDDNNTESKTIRSISINRNRSISPNNKI